MTAKPVKQNSTRKTTNENSANYSYAPNGEAFALPGPDDYAKEFKRLQKLVAKHRKEGREIVVVMGVGFVGAVMAGIVADSVQKPGINGDILGNRE
ncbi:MAG: hypothetical protein ACYC6Q_05990, partial [Syntrophales bacterium]